MEETIDLGAIYLGTNLTINAEQIIDLLFEGDDTFDSDQLMLTGATIDDAASMATAAGFTFDAGPGEQGAISIATQGTAAFANVTQGSAIDVEITFTAAGEDGALAFMVEAADEGEGARAINLNVLDPEAFMGDL